MIWAAVFALAASAPAEAIAFKKTVIDSRFVSEGLAVGDVNRDEKLDIVAGNVWYEGPRWVPHEIAPVAKLDPKTQYSNCFHTWLADLNHDGWLDQIVIGMPGERAIWRENPRGQSIPWSEHPIWRNACNESPLYVHLFRKGKKVLVMGSDESVLAWFEPAKDPYAEWICHPISGLGGAGAQRYSHGLGVGDLDGDKKNEVLTTEGFYTVPSDPDSSPWPFTKASLGPECAQMCVGTIGRSPDRFVFTSSAHRRGVWAFKKGEAGAFDRLVIDETISETHAAVFARLGKDKVPNFVTGKRKWAHPPGMDIGWDEDSLLVRYELKMGQSGLSWQRYVIDEDSGVGTQFVVEDVNKDGMADIVVSNKNGVFLFVQQKA
ncbi:MAG: VCBS repeat-containing protein [Armatimonadetes bacterium]|nr:VCBS repeat-containing protein [Armatimonadota bacterium]